MFGDLGLYLKFFLALGIVLGLIAGMGWVLRRLTDGGKLGGFVRPARRLKVVEAAAVDNKRRLVLVRRDEVEHLLLIGGGNDLVIEAGLAAKDGAGPMPPQSGEPAVGTTGGQG